MTYTPSEIPAYERGSDRRNTFRTFDTCQCPPRAVRTPREFSTKANPRRSETPLARSDSTIGSTLAAKVSASSVRDRRPNAAASRALRGLPSLAPCAFRAASAAFCPFRDQPAFLFRQRSVEVQHERVCIRAKLGDYERNTLGHEIRNEGYVAGEPVELGNQDRTLRPAGTAAAVGVLVEGVEVSSDPSLT